MSRDRRPPTLSSTDRGSFEGLDPADWLNRSARAAQPLRGEINRIVVHYIILGSLHELNLSHQHRTDLLNALQYTTHPSAFSNMKFLLGTNLRYWAHPNFIRWSICYGNPPWNLSQWFCDDEHHNWFYDCHFIESVITFTMVLLSSRHREVVWLHKSPRRLSRALYPLTDSPYGVSDPGKEKVTDMARATYHTTWKHHFAAGA